VGLFTIVLCENSQPLRGDLVLLKIGREGSRIQLSFRQRITSGMSNWDRAVP